MVKPAGAFLDICRDVANTSPVPVAAYQVSGEYAMLSLSAKAGVFDLKRAVLESVASFRRAGVTIIITYFAPLLLDYAALASDDALKVYHDALAKRDSAAN
jgi:porphobilinogen synthase